MWRRVFGKGQAVGAIQKGKEGCIVPWYKHESHQLQEGILAAIIKIKLHKLLIHNLTSRTLSRGENMPSILIYVL